MYPTDNVHIPPGSILSCCPPWHSPKLKMIPGAIPTLRNQTEKEAAGPEGKFARSVAERNHPLSPGRTKAPPARPKRSGTHVFGTPLLFVALHASIPSNASKVKEMTASVGPPRSVPDMHDPGEDDPPTEVVSAGQRTQEADPSERY